MSNYRGATRPSIVRRLEVCTRKRCCGAVRWHCQSGHCDRQSGRPTMQHMARQFHFISGLPRSGSTLLGAVLRQNPRFSAGMMSPIGSLLGALQTHFSAGSEFGPVVEVDLRRRLLRGLFESYYGDRAAGGVVFDSNRAWCARLPAIKDLYPGAKVIACVRNVAWVMDSIERLYRANPFENTKLFNDDVERNTVYSRVETLAQGGRLALALVGLMPVRLTVLAPAEVVPAEPFLVRAPLDGVIDHFNVRPNQTVAAGDPLFDLDTTTLRAHSSVAHKAYDVASEEYRQAAQGAVTDERRKLEMVERRGELEEKALEMEYSQQLLDRVLVKAARDGVAVFADAEDWQGRAVSIGERKRAKIRVDAAAPDATEEDKAAAQSSVMK